MEIPDDDLRKGRDILNRRLGANELREILKQLLQTDRLSEVEISEKYMREPADFLIIYFNFDLLSKRQIRTSLVTSLMKVSRNEVVKLYVELGYEHKDRPRDDDKKLMDICSLKRWIRGGIKSISFSNFFGFPEGFSGVKKRGIKVEPSEEVLAAERWGKLHEYQEILLEKMDDWYGNVSDNNSGMLVMPTGTGKTRVAASLIIEDIKRRYNTGSRVNRTVLWIAHTKELIEQAYETFRMMWVNEGVPGKPLKLTRFYGDIDSGELLDSWGIVVGGIQKIYESIKDKESDSARIIGERLTRNLGLVVIDEAHLAENPSYRKVLDFLSKADGFTATGDNGWKLLGLTATPFKSDDKRTKKLNQLFQKRFQLTERDDLKNIERYGVYEWFKKNRYMSHDVRYFPLTLPEKKFFLRSYERTHFHQFQTLASTALSRLALDDYRNDYIIKEITDAIEGGSRKILLFACSVPHCYLLHALLTSRDIDSRFVIGMMTRRERDENISWFRKNNNDAVVLINFHILTTGFDDPTIDTVFITRPTGSKVLYHQMIGRGLRGKKNRGNKDGICRIYDVKDNFDEFEGLNIIDYDSEKEAMSDY